MPPSKLSQDREAMIEHFKENTAGENLEVLISKLDSGAKRHVLEFRDENGNNYHILLLSRQWEFAPNFQYEQKNFDEDRRKLLSTWKNAVDFIAETNAGGKIPGFVFLRSDTDYSYLKDRKKTPVGERDSRIINRGGHFLKQALPNEWNPEPYFDERELDPLELVVKHFNYQTKGLPGRKPTYKRRKNYSDETSRDLGRKIYTPENYYFNPKSGQVNVVWFMDMGDPLKYRLDRCPVCSNPNGEKYDHSSCKEQPAYSRYRFRRDYARYNKLILAPSDRQPGNIIQFDPVEIILPSLQGMKLARIRSEREKSK